MRDATPPVTVFAEHPLSDDLRDSLVMLPPCTFRRRRLTKNLRDHEDVVGASLNPNSPIANYFSTCLPCYLTPILTCCAGCMWRTPLSIAPRLAPVNTLPTAMTRPATTAPSAQEGAPIEKKLLCTV